MKNIKTQIYTDLYLKANKANAKFDYEWLTTIYYQKHLDTSDIEDCKPRLKIIKMRVFATAILVIINFLTFWLSIESVKYAMSINLNLGVVS